MQDAVVNKIKSKIAHGKFGEVTSCVNRKVEI